MKTAYEKANKPRHIVNGHAFKSFEEAMEYIQSNGFKLERLEKIFKISIYHVCQA
jgi:hypothetical protein